MSPAKGIHKNKLLATYPSAFENPICFCKVGWDVWESHQGLQKVKNAITKHSHVVLPRDVKALHARNIWYRMMSPLKLMNTPEK